MVSHAKALELLPEGTRLDTLEWTKEYVQKIAPLEIWERRDPQDAFQLVKRGDFARWLVKARLLPLQESKHQFTDLDPSDPNYPYIMTALEAGIIEKTDSFRPKDPILRADAGIWLINSHGDLAKKRAQEFSEPLIPAQDGYDGIPDRAMGALSTCYAPDYQLMEYRHVSLDDFRYVQAEAPLLTGEAAYSLYQLVYPPQRGGEVVIGLPEEPKYLFWHLAFPQINAQIFSLVYEESDRRLDSRWGIFPTLTKRIPTKENGLWKINYDEQGNFINMELTFELRKGLKWSDGSPITADDFVFWRYLYFHPAIFIFPEVRTEEYYSLDYIEAIDDFTIKTSWNSPFLYCDNIVPLPRKYFEEKYEYHLEPYDLNNPDYYIPPEYPDNEGYKSEKYLADMEFVRKCNWDELYNKQPLHAGPYKVTSWIPNKKMILEANDYFYLGKPLLNKITLNFYQTTNELFDAVLNEDIDMTLYGLNSEKANKLQDLEKLNHIPYCTPCTIWEHIDFNVDDPTLSDVRVRQALAYSIDKNELIELVEDFGSLSQGWLIPQHPSYELSKLKMYNHDTEKAKLLLDEAGWKLNEKTMIREKNKQALSITLMTGIGIAYREKIQNVISSQWKAIGVDVKIKNEEASKFFRDTLQRRNFDGPTAAMYSWIWSHKFQLYPLIISDEIPTQDNYYEGINYTGYSNKKVDDLSKEIEKSNNSKEIYQRISEIHSILVQELPSIPLYFKCIVSSAHIKIANFKPSFTDSPSTWNAAYWYWKSEEATTLTPQISVKPEKLNFFEVARGINSMQKITISNVGANLLTGSINTDSPCITFDTREFSVEPQQTQEIQITLHPDKIEQAGLWGSTIEITSNDPDRPKLTLPTEATLLSPKLKLSLESIDFGTIRKSDPPLQKLDISNEGGESLELSLSSSYPALQLSESHLSIPPRESKSIQIKLDLSLIESYGAFEGTLNIQSNDPEQAQVIIPFKGSYGVVITLKIDNPIPIINGEPAAPLDAAPFILQGRTMIPLRFVAEGFGAKVEYNFAAQREIQITLDLMRIRLWIDNPKALIEPLPPSKEPNKEITLDVPPLIRNARSFVPLRFISETFGAKVEWEASTQTVTIYFK
jgi:peptide/nickel transport system substrate-binding protein